MVVVLLWITGAGAYLGAVVVARHRAQAAADLAALAAAGRMPAGAAVACAWATATARAMRVDDIRCVAGGADGLADLDVIVTVAVAVRVGVFPAATAVAAARAGPADTS
jgi:secretion/DNA translocation related TadE-like protein